MKSNIEFVVENDELVFDEIVFDELVLGEKEQGQKSKYIRIDVSTIDTLYTEYSEELIQFCQENGLKPPNKTSNQGIALAAMTANPTSYWDSDACNEYFAKFNIKSNNPNQAFNKHNQWGAKTNSGIERNRLYIVYPYALSNKHKMRKDFKFDGTVAQKNDEIDKIKSTITTDYIDVPNEQWQLGHKNPGSTDSSNDNLVLQPPIQGKYRDNYVFIDTLTKFPLASKLKSMIEKKEVEFTPEQIASYKALFDKLAT